MSTKGVYLNKRTGKWGAQYWSKELKQNIAIGTYDSQTEAIEARMRHITGVYDGTIDDSLPKTKGYPKGVSEISGSSRYKAVLQFWHGKYNDKQTSVHIGSYDTVEEAQEARTKFILGLL